MNILLCLLVSFVFGWLAAFLEKHFSAQGWQTLLLFLFSLAVCVVSLILAVWNVAVSLHSLGWQP